MRLRNLSGGPGARRLMRTMWQGRSAANRDLRELGLCRLRELFGERRALALVVGAGALAVPGP